MFSSIPSQATAGFFSRGIMRWSAVRTLLPEFHEFKALRKGSSPAVDAIIGWGAKPTSERARLFARKHHLPYIAIEDGFLRSYGLGVEHEQPHSLVIDQRGIYYDAHRPSDLEQYLLHDDFSAEELARARACMVRIRQHRLSKYNSSPDRSPDGLEPGKRYVLVVDQTRDDASVTLGMGSAERFTEMLEKALAQHPDAQILIKVHPDVASGHRQGYLAEGPLPSRCRRISEALNPWALLDYVEAVHVVTSQLGFEALMAGCKVFCHGMPFYAGWGLTVDDLTCTRRNVQRSLEQLFAAAYLRYSRYYNPYTAKPCTIEQTINLLSDQKRQSERGAGHWAIHGMSGWKRRFIHHFLGPKATTRYIKDTRNGIQLNAGEKVLVWGYKESSQLIKACSEQKAILVRMEDGFVRSAGLGADLVRPCSLVLDQSGLYYDSSGPSDLELLLQSGDYSSDLLERAQQVRKQLVEMKLSKYNLNGKALPSLPSDKEIILVPGQVESDASIKRGSRIVSTNAELLRRVRERRPDALILYKEHPDVTSGGRLGALKASEQNLYDIDVAGVNITDLLERVDAVHTMSSLTGFEALLRGVRVHTWGSPFYSGWGLTEDEDRIERRTRQLTLDELVAGTLLLYPIYVEPITGHLCNIETIIELIRLRATGRTGPSLRVKFWRAYRRIFERQVVR